MRFEGKHRSGKIASRSAITRVNICRTIAIRHQLDLNFRFMNKTLTKTYNYKIAHKINFQDLSYFSRIKYFIPDKTTSDVILVKFLETNGCKFNSGTIFVILRDKPVFYLVDTIFLDKRKEIKIIRKKLEDVFLREHSQSFVVQNIDKFEWEVLNLDDLSDAIKSVKNKDSKGHLHITKKWI